MNPQQPKHTNPGLASSLVGAAKGMVALVINRIELAALEFSEIGSHVFKVLLVGALSVVALWFALVFWSGLIVLLAWETLGWKILLILAALFTIVTIGLGLYMREVLRQGRLGLPTTVAELRKDRDALL